MFSLLKKRKYRVVIFLMVLLGNLWIWKVFATNLLIGVTVPIATFLLYIYQAESKYKYLLFVIFSLTLLFQFSTNEPYSLTNLTNDQIRVRDMRLKEYPHTYIKIGSKAAWFPVDEWFENGKGFRIFNRTMVNISQVVSPNLYFFSNHPRERIGVREFEKFPYIFLPFLLYGIVLNVNKKKITYLFSLLLPLLLISIIGNENVLGPFSLIPFLVVSIVSGIEHAHLKLEKKQHRYKPIIYLTFVFFVLLLLIQMYSYNVQ